MYIWLKKGTIQPPDPMYCTPKKERSNYILELIKPETKPGPQGLPLDEVVGTFALSKASANGMKRAFCPYILF